MEDYAKANHGKGDERRMIMSDIPETDQWLLDGDCTKCRRNNCSKPCTIRKKNLKEFIQRQIAAATHIDEMKAAMRGE